MLTIKFRELEEDQSHPLQAICPWIDFITPDIVLNKDGSLLAAFEYSGLDPDNLFDERVDNATDLLQRSYASFDERITAWWIVDKRRDPAYSDLESSNEASVALDKAYSKVFKQGRRFRIRYYFFLLFTGSTGTDKYLDRVSRLQSEGMSLSAALGSALRESLSGTVAFARDINQLRENVDVFNRAIMGFTQTAPLKFDRLTGDDFTGALDSLLNRASTTSRYTKPRGALLDAWLPSNYIASHKEVLQFKGNTRTVFAGVLGLVKWPETTSPMMFETLIAMPMEITICQIVRFLGTDKSRGEINAAIEYYKLTQFGLITHAMAKASNREPEPLPGKQDLLLECQEALTGIETHGDIYTYHNATVFVYGETPTELKHNIESVDRALARLKFKAIRERKNAAPSFAAMLPGQWSQQTRYELLSLENVANCTPIYTMSEGSPTHPFFSQDIYKKPVPALAMFGNRYGGRAYFVPHVGQVGHMLIVAPTGGGKTTFVNFCLSQFQRYGNTNTFVFDRNMSCKIVTELHDGRHIDIKNNNARLNPFFAMMDGSADGQTWVREFILRRLQEGGFVPTADDRIELDDALTDLARYYQENRQPLRMSDLATILSKRLSTELSEWLEGRPYGMFDTVIDDFSLTNWTTIEMKDIMAVERISRAFMDYAFRKIDTSLDGRPTFIYLEEASFLLNNPVFKEMLADWLKTFRKKNAFVWMTIQSPESITDSDIAATLLDNVYSFLMCVNEKVESHRAGYKHFFGLEDHQVDMIASLQPKRDYLLIQGSTSRVLTTEFTPECLAYLRSEASVLNTYDQHRARGNADWKSEYLAAIAKQ
jgi:type IV secretion system protein VirB4